MKLLSIDADGLRDFVLANSEFYLGDKYSNIGRYFVLSGQQSFTDIPIDINTLFTRNYKIHSERNDYFSMFYQIKPIVIRRNQLGDDNCKFVSFQSMNFIIKIYTSRSSPIETNWNWK